MYIDSSTPPGNDISSAGSPQQQLNRRVCIQDPQARKRNPSSSPKRKAALDRAMGSTQSSRARSRTETHTLVNALNFWEKRAELDGNQLITPESSVQRSRSSQKRGNTSPARPTRYAQSTTNSRARCDGNALVRQHLVRSDRSVTRARTKQPSKSSNIQPAQQRGRSLSASPKRARRVVVIDAVADRRHCVLGGPCHHVLEDRPGRCPECGQGKSALVCDEVAEL